MNDANPRRAIVTGGSSGIGRAVALGLASAGFDVGITYRSNRKGSDDTGTAVRGLGRNFAAETLDLRELDAIPRTLTTLAEALAGVDVLVNNAGMNRRVPAAEETLSDWQALLAVNLTAPLLAVQTVIPYMTVRGGGRIVNVTSILDTEPLSGGAAYCSSKAGLAALTRVLALELAPLGILVNAVAPGHTLTPMNYEGDLPEAHAFPRPVIPTRRAAEPEEVAAAIVFLASPLASYITGARILVDGGMSLVGGPETFQRETGFPPKDGT